jgi:cobalt/nickel transport system permease protein
MSGSPFRTFSHLQSPVHRAPAAAKLVLVLALILGVGALPAQLAGWGLVAVPALLVVARVAHLPFGALSARLALALPFLLGALLLALFQRHGLTAFLALLVKSSVSLLALQVLANTLSISDLLRTLQRAHVPEILRTTIALRALG